MFILGILAGTLIALCVAISVININRIRKCVEIITVILINREKNDR